MAEDWSKLTDDVLLLIAFSLFSFMDLLCFRSVCTSWRSSASVADINHFPSRPHIQLNPLVVTVATTSGGYEKIYGLDRGSFLSRASFFRLSHLSSSKTWLIKYEPERLSYGKIRLLNPLSRLPLRKRGENIDLLDYNLVEIQAAYVVQDWRRKRPDPGYKRLVLDGNNRVTGVGCDGKIRYWNGNIWTRIRDQHAQFCDIVVRKGVTYAVDSEGIVWRVSPSTGILRYGPSLYENITERCWTERRLVDCCGEFYIVDRILEENPRKRKAVVMHPLYSDVIHDDFGNMKCELSEKNYYSKTVGFQVYKMDEEQWKWVQVKSLGDNAFVMATDTSFSVLAHEFFGCLQNSIYFSDEEEYDMKVFNLEDGRIKTMSGESQSCFQMFLPSFD